ncbi:MAG: hypothetical protein BWY71_02086 [Planctomycetes bacterium ADurb.Bin412]|nr:MAG: hypothetical protein BWY71_02086 [Planctomycetes bacterium ADurb.Bin412]
MVRLYLLFRLLNPLARQRVRLHHLGPAARFRIRHIQQHLQEFRHPPGIITGPHHIHDPILIRLIFVVAAVLHIRHPRHKLCRCAEGTAILPRRPLGYLHHHAGPDLVLQRLHRVPRRYMHRLVTQHRRQLPLVAHPRQQTGRNIYLPARQRKRIRHIRLQHRVFIRHLPVRMGGNLLPHHRHILLHRIIRHLSRKLFFKLRGVLHSHRYFLRFRNQPQFLLTRYRIRLAARRQ